MIHFFQFSKYLITLRPNFEKIMRNQVKLFYEYKIYSYVAGRSGEFY
jgi:hypothetical protein